MKYFDAAEEFFELVDWYLAQDDEKKIADAGMKRVHEQFNCVKIPAYNIPDLVENGSYGAA